MLKFREVLWFLDKASTLPAFELESAGITHPDPTYHIARPHGVDFYTFEYVVSGHGKIAFEGQTIKMEAGDAYLLPPHIPVEYWSDRHDPWEKHWINIAGALPEHLVEVYQLEGAAFFKACPVGTELEAVLNTVRTPTASAPLDFALALHRLVAAMAAHWRKIHTTQGNENAIVLKHYCEEHWREPVRLAELAAFIGRSPVQTLRIFSKEWGCTPEQWLQERRFAFAKQYLINTNYTMREIADLTGFKDEFYFANWFKRRSGMAPGHFRKSGAH